MEIGLTHVTYVSWGNSIPKPIATLSRCRRQTYSNLIIPFHNIDFHVFGAQNQNVSCWVKIFNLVFILVASLRSSCRRQEFEDSLLEPNFAVFNWAKYSESNIVQYLLSLPVNLKCSERALPLCHFNLGNITKLLLCSCIFINALPRSPKRVFLRRS